MKFGHVAFEMCEQTDIQTYGHTHMLIAILLTRTRSKVIECNQ